ncbi:MAG: response regulator [Candidatus Pacebacteria bacterium]|nr:response regulator [Candidatus Paceibacterota bacterium]
MAKILVVDDDELIRKLLLKYLEGRGHQVTICSNGVNAISIVDDGNTFDICILDFNIGGGFDGGSLRIFLSQFLPKETIYFLATSDERVEGFDRFFPKPFRMDDIGNAIEDELNKKGEE